MRAAAALTLLLCLGAGCFTSASPEECRVDAECGGLVCTRVGECAAETRTMRIEWTVRGLTTDQTGACTGIGELEVMVSDPTIGADHVLRPVPCGVGSFYFDKLPLGYTVATVSAYATDGALLDSERGTVDGDGVVRFELLAGR